MKALFPLCMLVSVIGFGAALFFTVTLALAL